MGITIQGIRIDPHLDDCTHLKLTWSGAHDDPVALSALLPGVRIVGRREDTGTLGHDSGAATLTTVRSIHFKSLAVSVLSKTCIKGEQCNKSHFTQPGLTLV